MSKYFSISGYWKDDKSEFEDYIVKEFDDVEDNESDDNLIFYYGLSEGDIKGAMNVNDDNMLDFVITSYREINIEEYFH